MHQVNIQLNQVRYQFYDFNEDESSFKSHCYLIFLTQVMRFYSGFRVNHSL